MNFVRKIVNDAAVAAWQRHYDGLQKEVASKRATAAETLNSAKAAIDAQQRYFLSHSAADLQAWREAKIRADAEFEMNQAITENLRFWVRDHADGLLFKAAVSSAKFLLESKRTEIVTDDAARSEDVGADVVSNRALDAIDGRLRQIKAASESFGDIERRQNGIGALSAALSA